ncbi:multidrug ABC transporter ATP-binding protein [Candidatus Cerribacteria bacterium 'Amazon FNV 2010 28 9']|uniref:Multidrug ABC transporter ATP-binding protein n=1 Tax=Candidatus Cerribacteria bacterium 'Amazon FNV 2010 28 9' TaxID=2081795 RepID=A0A317JQK4_9BACT|nr:MAG: multidrug ABC transporter ATP-binding protein [Candidatus Cerribacteria bacterium 'Amazon FNV 2010 28 9']
MDSSIRVQSLIKKFGDFTAVNNISFEVNQGEIFAFLGPNGAGKTTTIKMLTTLLRPTSGTLLLMGTNPTKDQDSARKSFGIVFQDPSLDEELTAYENLHFHAVLYGVPKQIAAKRIKELLEVVELSDRKNDLVKTFSGGMRRRLEIARGLLHHPHIFFLDEPTIGLDPQTRNQIWEYIKKLNKEEGITIFFTTHYMEEADRVANRIAVIDHGTIIAIDTPQAIKKKAKAQTLEDAFLSLTGHQLRDEKASAVEHMRMRRQMWRGR